MTQRSNNNKRSFDGNMKHGFEYGICTNCHENVDGFMHQHACCKCSTKAQVCFECTKTFDYYKDKPHDNTFVRYKCTNGPRTQEEEKEEQQPATKKVKLCTTYSLPNNSWLKLRHRLPDDLQADEKIFQSLIDLKPTERGQVVIYGKTLDVPRWQKLYGPSYHFGGKTHHGQGEIDHPFIKKLQEWVCDDSGLKYTQVIVNWYMNGSEYIGPHSDNEGPIIPNSSIYSFTYGATRDFVITGIKHKYKLKLELPNNSLLVMGGEMQQHYKHQVPKRLRVTKPRINITFRAFKDEQ